MSLLKENGFYLNFFQKIKGKELHDKNMILSVQINSYYFYQENFSIKNMEEIKNKITDYLANKKNVDNIEINLNDNQELNIFWTTKINEKMVKQIAKLINADYLSGKFEKENQAIIDFILNKEKQKIEKNVSNNQLNKKNKI